ncbi:MAG: biotin-dependent carboxyltransferase family protein [Thiolinea sp.]
MMKVIQPGVMALVQDGGRIGKHRIGLTTGGPLDRHAMDWANRLCGNAVDTTALEISIGGLVLEAQQDTVIAVTGADMPLSIGKQPRARWQTQPVKAGERIELGYAQQGCRTYLAVAGGFQVEPMFGSTATVVREKLGGLHGKALANGDVLPCPATAAGSIPLQQLATEHRPQYASSVTLRVIPGYQQAHFSAAQQALFFSSTYTVSEQCDRMGYRLEGQPVQADITSMLSEGICYGAIQIPANGQPIVLLNDRQTIGGYPVKSGRCCRWTSRASPSCCRVARCILPRSVRRKHTMPCNWRPTVLPIPAYSRWRIHDDLVPARPGYC